MSKLGVAACAFNPSTEAETGKSLGFAGMAKLVGSKFVEMPCLQNIRWRGTEKDSRHWPLTSIYMCAHMHMQLPHTCEIHMPYT